LKRRDFQYLLSRGNKKKYSYFTVYFNLSSQNEITVLISKKLTPVKRNKIKRRLKSALNTIFKSNFIWKAIFFANEKILSCNYQKLINDFKDLYIKLNNDKNFYPFVAKAI